MSKGTPSMGKKSGKVTHITCRRCSKHSYHIHKHRCASCGYGKSTKQRDYEWKVA